MSRESEGVSWSASRHCSRRVMLGSTLPHGLWFPREGTGAEEPATRTVVKPHSILRSTNASHQLTVNRPHPMGVGQPEAGKTSSEAECECGLRALGSLQLDPHARAGMLQLCGRAACTAS